VSIGLYGAKCTCESSTIRGGLCKHAVASLIAWNLVNVGRYGKPLDLDGIRFNLGEGGED
jgi:hypothetical protein